VEKSSLSQKTRRMGHGCDFNHNYRDTIGSSCAHVVITIVTSTRMFVIAVTEGHADRTYDANKGHGNR